MNFSIDDFFLLFFWIIVNRQLLFEDFRFPVPNSADLSLGHNQSSQVGRNLDKNHGSQTQNAGSFTSHAGLLMGHAGPMTCHAGPLMCQAVPASRDLCDTGPLTCHVSPLTCHAGPFTCQNKRNKLQNSMISPHRPPPPFFVTVTLQLKYINTLAKGFLAVRWLVATQTSIDCQGTYFSLPLFLCRALWSITAKNTD